MSADPTDPKRNQIVKPKPKGCPFTARRERQQFQSEPTTGWAPIRAETSRSASRPSDPMGQGTSTTPKRSSKSLGGTWRPVRRGHLAGDGPDSQGTGGRRPSATTDRCSFAWELGPQAAGKFLPHPRTGPAPGGGGEGGQGQRCPAAGSRPSKGLATNVRPRQKGGPARGPTKQEVRAEKEELVADLMILAGQKTWR